MTATRIIGVILIVLGVIAFVSGGVFWTDRDTVVDAGPLQIETENTEGFALSPILGGIALVGGIILLLVPQRRRA